MVKLLKDPELASHMGAAAKERVRQHFLLPRLLLDYLKAAQASLESKTRVLNSPVPAIRDFGMSLVADGGC